MIPHGAAELLELAAGCSCSEPRVINGWLVDVWALNDLDLAKLAAAYRAVLLGDTEAETAVSDLLASVGIELENLLLDEAGANERVTRADAVELAGAASLLAVDRWPAVTLHMPNVPAMSRAKSDSGNDAMALDLSIGLAGDLAADDRLYVASVKHSIQGNITDIRNKLADSVLPGKLSQAYMATQLRVFSAWLVEAGMAEADATRVYLFLRQWPDFDHVSINAVAGIDSSLAGQLERSLRSLPLVEDDTYRLRILLIPNISELHERLA